jgi:predicted phosphoribosyltransferase/dienelactone hydrolase
MAQQQKRAVTISGDKLEGDLVIPRNANAIILFAHGSGSSRYSTRNQYVAQILNDAGFATLLVDLLTHKEKKIDEKTRHLRFNIDLLADRLLKITDWVMKEPDISRMKIGFFGSSTGTAAALISAVRLKDVVKAIVSRGGRPDLADSKDVLPHITAPVLLIVGGNDTPVVEVNKIALSRLSNAAAKELAIISGAGHLFEELGKMEEVAQVTAEWFNCCLSGSGEKFENKHNSKTSGLLSVLKEKSYIQLRFKNRVAAGEMLASLSTKYQRKDSIMIIGIPRGGVVVAAAVARKLSAFDFDIVLPRKLRAPDNSENAIGAVMQDGSVYLDENAVRSKEISNEYLELEKSEQSKEINRRMALYRGGEKDYRIKGRTIILVDDGAATGATMIAAARWIRTHQPNRLVIAIPVASQQAAQLLKQEADHLEILKSSSKFKSVQQFYQDFGVVSDEEVIKIMKNMNTMPRKGVQSSSDGIEDKG